MTDEKPTNMPNAAKISQAHKMLDELFSKMLLRGWFGRGGLTFLVKDGHLVDVEINSNRRERFEKPAE